MTTLLTATITTAGTVNGTPFRLVRRNGYRGLSMQVNFVYGTSGGTTVDAKIQTSLDGVTWTDIWHATTFTTASARRAAGVQMVLTPAVELADATVALASGQVRDNLLGDQIRAVFTSVGTYVGATTIQVDVFGDQWSVTP